MVASFYTALSGANALQTSIDTWGDNIANATTAGFRGNDVEFASLLSQSFAGTTSGTLNTQGGGIGTYNQVGLGVRVSATSMMTGQGSIQNTEKNFDLAINGDGWFMVQGSNGMPAYTRDGAFVQDINSNLVTASGNKVYGMSSPYMTINADGTGTITNTATPDNLLTNTANPLVLPFEMTYPATPAVPATVITMPDQTVTLTKQTDQTMTYPVTLPASGGVTVDFGYASSETGTISFTDSSGTVVNTITLTTQQLNDGTYTWDGTMSDGSTAPAGSYSATIEYNGATPVQIGYALPIATPATVIIQNSAGETITTLYPSLQGAGQNYATWNGRDSDGNAVPNGDYTAVVSYILKPEIPAIGEGNLSGYYVNTEGQVIAGFDNGMSTVVAQVPIYHFQNDQGLERAGDNLYSASSNSGDAFLMTTPSGETIQGAVIQSYALEMSNVSLSTAMTNLIITQRSFDANSKCIKTSDELIQRAINLKRG